MDSGLDTTDHCVYSQWHLMILHALNNEWFFSKRSSIVCHRQNHLSTKDTLFMKLTKNHKKAKIKRILFVNIFFKIFWRDRGDACTSSFKSDISVLLSDGTVYIPSSDAIPFKWSTSQALFFLLFKECSEKIHLFPQILDMQYSELRFKIFFPHFFFVIFSPNYTYSL